MPELDFDVQTIKRSGAKKFIDIAKTACRIVTATGAIMKKLFPVSPKLHLLIDGIAALCPLIGDASLELEALDNDPVDEPDGTQWPGINLYAVPFVEG